MSVPTIVMVTGATKGIGRTLVETYLLRPNHTVIGSVRDKESPLAKELQTLPTGEGSKILVVKIENTSTTDPTEAVKELKAAGVNHLDIVIANAGGNSTIVSVPLDLVSAEEMKQTFETNAIGPLLLYQAVKPLLIKSSNSPKFVPITTIWGSIKNLPKYRAERAPAYGASKAGLNWLTVAAHSANDWLIAFVIHPGFIQTESGNAAARVFGVAQATHTTQQSVAGIMKLIDGATRRRTSGKFLQALEGPELPW